MTRRRRVVVRSHQRRTAGGSTRVARHLRNRSGDVDTFGRPRDERPVWQKTRAGYQSDIGIHQPWIAEISPMQYGMMSKRARAAYDEKHSREWQASGDAKAQYDRLVVEAHERGEFTKATPSVSKDALDAVLWAKLAAEKAAAKASHDARHAANSNITIDDLKVGDVVNDIMGGNYGVVVKKNKKSVQLRSTATEGYMAGREWKADVGRLQWKRYGDV